MPITKASGQAVAVAAKGDLVVGSATNDAAVLGVGSANQVLTVDSSTTTGLKWATPSSTVPSWSQISDTQVLSGSTFTISNLSSYNRLYVAVSECTSASGTPNFNFRINGDSASNYRVFRLQLRNATSYSTSVVNSQGNYNAPQTSMTLATASSSVGVNGILQLDNMLSANNKLVTYAFGSQPADGIYSNVGGGYYVGSSVSSVSFILSSSSYSDARFIVYGSTL